MSSLCFCKQEEDDFVCLCYYSDEETDEEEDESVDDIIDGGGKEIQGESVGIDVPCTVTQSCSSTAIAECSETGNTKVGHLNGEISNGDFRSSESRNDDPGNDDLMNSNNGNREKKSNNNREQGNGNPGSHKNNSKSVDKFRPNPFVSLTSSEAEDLRIQPNSALEHDSTSDLLNFLNGGSMLNKEQYHLNEDMANTDPSFSTDYEWQFQEKDGSWVGYDNINATGGLQSFTKITTTISQDIERYRKSHLTPSPIVFRVNHHRYVLDFQSMTEHSAEDGTDRPIRRVPKITPKQTCDEIPLTVKRGLKNSVTSQGMGFLLSSVTEVNKPGGVELCSALPSYWNPMQEDALFCTVPLNTSSAEYESLVSLVKQSYPILSVTQITRIQNLQHYQAFGKRRTCLKLQFPDVHFREEVLFHGTNSENVESICKKNFDWRLFGKANGHLLGRGVYFTNKATIAANYAKRGRLVGMRQRRPADAGPHDSSAWGLLGQPPSRPLFTLPPLSALPLLSVLPSSSAWRPSSALPQARALLPPCVLPPLTAIPPLSDFPPSSVFPQSNFCSPSSVFPQSRALPPSSFVEAFPNASARVFFIVKVLIGRYIKGCSSSDKPPDDKYGLPYDTTVDNLWYPTVFVKYNNEEYYPQYFVEFE